MARDVLIIDDESVERDVRATSFATCSCREWIASPFRVPPSGPFASGISHLPSIFGLPQFSVGILEILPQTGLPAKQDYLNQLVCDMNDANRARFQNVVDTFYRELTKS